MSTKVKTGWLKDEEGKRFAPKTLTSQIQTNDGVLLEDKINDKVDKVEGKQLSTNDYTTEEKNKVSKIDNKAEKTDLENFYTKSQIDSFGFITAEDIDEICS